MIDDTVDPLASNSELDWARLFEAIDSGAILLVIKRRMSDALLSVHAPEDVFQEAQLRAWEGRLRFEWRGLRSFRAWFLTIIDHCIRDLVEYQAAKKRGGKAPTPFSALARSRSDPAAFAVPVQSTTPSRLAIYREQAAAREIALEAVPDDLREILNLRAFEDMTAEQVAIHLDLGVSAVRYRYRKAAEIFQRRLRAELASRPAGITPESAPVDAGDPRFMNGEPRLRAAGGRSVDHRSMS